MSSDCFKLPASPTASSAAGLCLSGHLTRCRSGRLPPFSIRSPDLGMPITPSTSSRHSRMPPSATSAMSLANEASKSSSNIELRQLQHFLQRADQDSDSGCSLQFLRCTRPVHYRVVCDEDVGFSRTPVGCSFECRLSMSRIAW
eukprot:s100_g32.t1